MNNHTLLTNKIQKKINRCVNNDDGITLTGKAKQADALSDWLKKQKLFLKGYISP